MQKSIPFSVVFLSGGTGARMGSRVPKQYLSINQKPIALYSFEVFLSLFEVQELIVVCDVEYESLFSTVAHARGRDICFARSGERRQDSVFNGIQQLRNDPLVCIHDAARPFIHASQIRHVVQIANSWDAAVIGVRVKSTIKVCDSAQVVIETPRRDCLWEVQTPQVIRLNLLKQGFSYAQEKGLTVTDDVSLVELIGKPVKVVEGSYDNIKITTQEDLQFAAELAKKYAMLQTDHHL